jgi:hypothetical protein
MNKFIWHNWLIPSSLLSLKRKKRKKRMSKKGNKKRASLLRRPFTHNPYPIR